jgi:hypothetical protein
MSWLKKIIGFGAAVVGIATGGWIGAIAKTVVTGYVVGKVTAAINKKNTPEQPPDPGVRAQVEPNPNHKVPVVYGTATLGGIVTDAQLTNSNQTMWYCLTICEQTGRLNLGQGAISTLYFDEIYWNDQKVAFASDGVTAASTTDRDGVVDTKINGLVKIYCYNGSSSNVMAPGGYVVANPTNAADLMPGWGADYNMPALVFALIRVDYNKDKGITGLGNVTFRIRNNMTQSGDCLYDYLTNTWYGAGIQATEIYVS